MGKFLTVIMLLGGLIVGSVPASGYKITKVIEVGPVAWVPFTGPLRWSPDGTMLAYFVNNYLMISDTLGNTREVKSIDIGISPRRFEWVSNDKVAINMPKRRESDSTLYKTITLVDVNTGQETIVAEWQTVANRAGNTYFEGPFLSLEGNAYYFFKTMTGRSKEIPLGRVTETIDESHWFFPDKAPAVEDNHFIRWNTGGLYLVNLNQTDSICPVESPHPGAFSWAAIRPDSSYVFIRGMLIRVADSAEINVNSFVGKPPPKTTGCGLSFVSFNPKSPEILFLIACDDGHMNEVLRIGTFDYTTNEFTILDTLIGISSCTVPAYAPDGRKIAFLDSDDYKAYIIYREEK
ncbi:MAG: hypothetical protein ABII79_13220 [bacterium]